MTDVSPVGRLRPVPGQGRSSGELIDVSAVVFREGHDAVAANVVFTGPAIRPARAGPGRFRATTGRPAPLLRMVAGPARHRPVPRPGRARTGWACGRCVVEAWSDPLGTWRHAVEAKAAAGQSADELANDLETGAQLLDRIGRRPGSPLRRRDQGGRRGAPRHRAVASPERIGPALAGDLWPVLTADPIRELITTSRHLSGLGGPAAGRIRLLVRVLPPVGRRAGPRGRHARSARHARGRRRDAAQGRADGLRHRLPAADPPDRRDEPQGPQQHRRHAEPDDVGSPWAIGSAEGGHDAVHPDLGTIEDFDAFVARGRPNSAWRSPSTWRCSAPPTTRGSPSTRSGSPPARTAASPTRRTRRRSTRTSTR